MWSLGMKGRCCVSIFLWIGLVAVILSAVVCHASPLPDSVPSQITTTLQTKRIHKDLSSLKTQAHYPRPSSLVHDNERANLQFDQLSNFGFVGETRRSRWCWVYTALSPITPLLPSTWESSVKRGSDSCASGPSSPILFPTRSHLKPSHALPARFNQYKHDVVLRFVLKSPQEATAIRDAADVLFLDVWEFTENWVDIRVARDVIPALVGLLPDSLQNSYTPLIWDLALTVAETYPHELTGECRFCSDRVNSPAISTILNENRPYHRRPIPLPVRLPSSEAPVSSHQLPGKSNIFFNDYQPLSVIHPWMRLLASMFPTHTKLINIGQSYEGRDILALKVSVHPTNSKRPTGPRRTIVISGGTHAREWISTMSVNFAAYTFITSYGKTQPLTELIEAFDWVFIPTLNPDGYVYTWEVDRLWRKNRQPTPLRFCKGIDIDRSFSFHWDEEASKNTTPCSESWPGVEPFEATEALALQKWVVNATKSGETEFTAFIDLHSYAQQVLYPYSYSCEDQPPSLENLQELALGLAKAIRLTPDSGSQVYQVLSACEGNVNLAKHDGTGTSAVNSVSFPRIIAGGGSALDWFYHNIRARFSYQIKLRDTGAYGFLLPREEITPTGHEMVEAFVHLGRYMLGEIGFVSDDEKSEPVDDNGLDFPTSPFTEPAEPTDSARPIGISSDSDPNDLDPSEGVDTSDQGSSSDGPTSGQLHGGIL